MSNINWTIRVRLSQRAKERAEEIAQADYRSISNYVRMLIERDIREKEPRNE